MTWMMPLDAWMSVISSFAPLMLMIWPSSLLMKSKSGMVGEEGVEGPSLTPPVRSPPRVGDSVLAHGTIEQLDVVALQSAGR